MFLAYLKLRERNLAPVLNANGWAVNAKSRVNVKFGETLTEETKFPLLPDQKKVMENGVTKYHIPTDLQVERKVLGMDSEIARLSILSVDFCGLFAIVKTKLGYANAVAYDIDDHGQEFILGTIAGDDTILVIPREGVTKEVVRNLLRAVKP